jgi:hypothetical protein
MTPTIRLHVQIEPQLGADLQRAAHELGVSTSELIRRGARRVVDEHRLEQLRPHETPVAIPGAAPTAVTAPSTPAAPSVPT